MTYTSPMNVRENGAKHRQGTSERPLCKNDVLERDAKHQARVGNATVLYKTNVKSKESRTLELYLRKAHAPFKGSLRSDLTEFSPLRCHEKNYSLLFFSSPHLIEGRLSQMLTLRDTFYGALLFLPRFFCPVCFPSTNLFKAKASHTRTRAFPRRRTARFFFPLSLFFSAKLIGKSSFSALKIFRAYRNRANFSKLSCVHRKIKFSILSCGPPFICARESRVFFSRPV